MKKTSRNLWIVVAIVAASVAIIIVLVGCARDETPSQPTSTTPTKTKMQTPDLDSSMLISPTVQNVPPPAASRSPTAPPLLPTLVPSAERVLDPHQMVENLIAHKWQLVEKQPVGLASEVTTWEFYPDGTFRWHFTSDYTESYVGAWAISAASAERGVIFLASAVNNQGPASRFDVLSFEFRNERLQLGETLYEGTPFTDQDMPPAILQQAHEAVTAPQRRHFFSLWAAITGSDWQSESDPPPGDPTMYSFMQDGVYTAHFAATQCQYSGTWSLFSSGGDAGEIRLSVPANQCDPRGPRDAFVREMPLTLSDAKLFLYQTIYASVPK